MDPHQEIIRAIDAYRPTVVAASKAIHDRPEPRFEEVFAAEQLSAAAAALGLNVEHGVGGLKTAFRAEFGKDGPTVAIFAEYDALPNGHSCGHNLIAGAALAAVAGLHAIAPRLNGKIVFMGTPAEEGGGGKVILMNRGALKGVDAAMMAHPMDGEWSTMPALATHGVRLTFHGKAAHAALAPWDGSSALAAMLQTFHAVDMARLHFRDGSRIHGIITNGGQATNIIPELTECQFVTRARGAKYAREMAERVIRCAEGAAMSAGTRVEHSNNAGYKNMINNMTVAHRYAAHSAALGAPAPDAPLDLPTGSTDMGDISHRFVAIHPVFAISSPGEGTCHEDAFVRHADSRRGYDAMIRVAKSLAMTAYDLLAEPDLLASAKAEFAASKES
ncbi:MAG TPA: amidohydrolase [Candidatus Binataceae bacterium]|nr:amidohydrolase [Candidatus Binataceae bacterium]